MDLSEHEGEIPIPIATTYIGGSGGGGHGETHCHSIIHDRLDSPPLHHPTNGPAPLSTASIEHHPNHNFSYSNSKKGVVVKYKECLKNHAASIGGNATDGCGEFTPSGQDGTLEALKCAACCCHRNFHRREVEGEEGSSFDCFHHLKGRKGLLISGSDAYGYCPTGSSFIPRLPPPHHMIMPFQTSESDEMEGVGGVMVRPPMVKKRFRTKFTPEQKEKMLGFAEKAGWKLQRQEEGVVQQFCQEIGVRRRVLKVWMHNNKHNLAKKSTEQLE